MKRILAICCASFAAWSVGTPALAQSVQPAASLQEQVGVNSSGASTTPSSEGVPALSEVIVTAQRRPEAAESAPLAITAVSGAELQTAGINTIEGLMVPDSTPEWIQALGVNYPYRRIDGTVSQQSAQAPSRSRGSDQQ